MGELHGKGSATFCKVIFAAVQLSINCKNQIYRNILKLRGKQTLYSNHIKKDLLDLVMLTDKIIFTNLFVYSYLGFSLKAIYLFMNKFFLFKIIVLN